ncbi:hypothetical protein ACLBQX_29750, partial [Klebsiella pneumoniae]
HAQMDIRRARHAALRPAGTRFPAVVLLGGMLIGWIAGSMLVSDPTIRQLFPRAGEGTARLAGAVGTLLVLFTGWRRRPRPQAKD